MPKINLPLAQSKTSRWFLGLAMAEGALWSLPHAFDASNVHQRSRISHQSHPSGRESSALTAMPLLIVTPISGSTLQPYMQNNALNRRFDLGNHAAAFWLDREGEMPLWL